MTGQSAAFLTYVRKSRHTVAVVNTNDEGTSLAFHVASSVRVIILTVLHMLFRKPQCVYISTSRSKLGAVKDLAVISIARFMAVPVVNHLHGTTFISFRKSLGMLYGSIVDWAYRYIAASIVLHESLISQYARYPTMRVAVVNNFVDSRIANSFDAGREINGPTNVLFLSNMLPEKGIFELIEAVKKLQARACGIIRLKIAGGFLPGAGLSSAEVEVNFLAAVAGSPEIEYFGFANVEDKHALLDWAHVLALPSYMKEEAVPLVLLEGMAAGCYLIVSDFGILPEVTKGLVAAVVPARDSTALQNALSAVLANPDLLHAAKSQNPLVARQMYSEAQYIAGIDRLIDEYGAEAGH